MKLKKFIDCKKHQKLFEKHFNKFSFYEFFIFHFNIANFSFVIVWNVGVFDY